MGLILRRQFTLCLQNIRYTYINVLQILYLAVTNGNDLHFFLGVTLGQDFDLILAVHI